MQNAPAMLYCPNPNCQESNPLTNKFCQKCRTPLIKRYLWGVGKGMENYKIGELVADRYLLNEDRIFLDTKPALVPDTSEEIPPFIQPYLKLFPYRLHIPQVYGLLPRKKDRRNIAEIWLLEQIPVDVSTGKIRPELIKVWKNAPAMRQLNWLWQMANLWRPLEKYGVSSSLIKPELLRVEGSIFRLLELSYDNKKTPTLKHLGQLWLKWTATADPFIANFLKYVCHQLIHGEIHSADNLVDLLEKGLAVLGRSQSRHIRIATRTDQGPSRRRNEDACYPDSDMGLKQAAMPHDLAIVCDGIGGHEGGNVASQLAIQAVQQRVQQLNLKDIDSFSLIEQLEFAACDANDLIADRNDLEQRQARQRMGTTLVMALAHEHEVYITHVGDTRAYLITPYTCYQITVDDDVASREARLGYALYRDALQQPTAGSLVQALGMSSSSTLHPTVGRFVIDEDCVFLLCSDGLSDNDRVEQYWETEILPILTGNTNIDTAADNLIDIANKNNGHDNVTVAVFYCQILANKSNNNSGGDLLAKLGLGLTGSEKTLIDFSDNDDSLNGDISDGKTIIVTGRNRQSNLLKFSLVIAILLALGGGLIYAFNLGGSLKSLILLNSSEKKAAIETPNSPVPIPVSIKQPLEVGTLMKIPDEKTSSDSPELELLKTTIKPEKTSGKGAKLIPGTILRVIEGKRERESGNSGNNLEPVIWLNVEVCFIPKNSNAGTNQNSVSVKSGWIQQEKVANFVVSLSSLTTELQNICSTNSNGANSNQNLRR